MAITHKKHYFSVMS